MPAEDVFEEEFFASLYDCVNPWSVSNDFYVDRAVEAGGPVLDLGCGTGMLACGMAAKGLSVTGVDPAVAMLRVARTRLRFPADDPSKVETFKVGIGARGVALDSKGNVWVTSLMSPDFPLPKIPAGVSIMQQFAMILEALKKNIEEGKKTGVVSMIRPDGTQLAAEGFTGGDTINPPWGIVVDGNDDVFAASGLGRGITMLAGVGTSGHAPGTKPGDLIHYFQGGTLQIPTIGSIDPAGNLWVANNWNSVEAATAANPIPSTSTWGGGSGFTVFYGVAAPVKTPLLGTVRPN